MVYDKKIKIYDCTLLLPVPGSCGWESRAGYTCRGKIRELSPPPSLFVVVLLAWAAAFTTPTMLDAQELTPLLKLLNVSVPYVRRPYVGREDELRSLRGSVLLPVRRTQRYIDH